MRAVSIYVDTSIKGPRRGVGACLYILSFESACGKTADTGSWVRKDATTENQLALLGLEASLRRLREPCRLALYLECAYVASALKNRWHETWRYNGWYNAKNEPVRDSGIWQSIQCLLEAHEFDVWLKQPHPYRGWMHRELEQYIGRLNGANHDKETGRNH